MAKILKSIKKFFFKVWYFRWNRKMKKINQKLQKSVEEQEEARKEFLNEFRFYLRKYLRKDASGKYIPLRGKNCAEVYETVMAVHGDRLNQLNIRFTKDLQIKL